MSNSAKAKLRILAIDTSASPGFAVLDYSPGKTPKLVYADALKTDSSKPDSERYAAIEAMTSLIVFKYGPFDVVCREHFTKGGSKRSTQLVFGAWSAVDSALGRFGYHIAKENEFTPSTVKKVATGDGKAPKNPKEAEEKFRKTGVLKKSVEEGVKEILGLAEDYAFPNNAGGDASDAVAVGLAWIDANV